MADLEQTEDALLALGAVAVTLCDGADQMLFDEGLSEQPVWETLRVQALFPDDTELDFLQAELSNVLGAPGPESWQLDNIPDQDWHRAWMERYEPLCFGNKLWVCPSWKPVPEQCSHPIVLDPGTAFGTGTHPTTSMCLQWLDAHDCSVDTVVDFGCGSGILAIAAAVLGAPRVIAIDNDPAAVRHSQENFEKNGLSAQQITAHLVGAYPVPEDGADLVVANILAGPLQTLADELLGLLKPGGQLVLSGILESQTKAVTSAYAAQIKFQPVRSDAGWVLLHGTRRPS